MVLWWRLALQQSTYHTLSYHHSLGGYLFKSTYHDLSHDGMGNAKVPFTVMKSSKCGQKSSARFKVHSKDHQMIVISLLLMLAGDIEKNPGPGMLRGTQ